MITTMPNGATVQTQSWPGNRHARGANLLFLDGHVEQRTQRAWLAKTPEMRRRWNYDDQPHPETWTDTLVPP